MVSTNWGAILSTGLSDVIGSWNTIASRSPRRLRNSSGRRAQHVAALKADFAADDPARFFQQPHQRQRGDAFSGTGLADDAEGLAGTDRESSRHRPRAPRRHR